MDDCLTASKTMSQMLINLEKIFEHIYIYNAGMLLRTEKYGLCKQQIKFLGFIIDEQGQRPDPKKVSAITNMLPLKSIKSIKTYLGMSGFFRKFIPFYSQKVASLTKLLKKDQPSEIGPNHLKVIETNLTH